MKKIRAYKVLILVCSALIIGGCQCKDCKDLRPGIIGLYDFGSVYFIAGGSGHCTDPHTIGISAGPSPCDIAIVGVDGWGTDNRYSNIKAKMKTTGDEIDFEIAEGQLIDAQGTIGCSSRNYLTVEGEGELLDNRLLLIVTFADSATGYNSGAMQIVYNKQ